MRCCAVFSPLGLLPYDLRRLLRGGAAWAVIHFSKRFCLASNSIVLSIIAFVKWLNRKYLIILLNFLLTALNLSVIL